jgi:hypothetical protein
MLMVGSAELSDCRVTQGGRGRQEPQAATLGREAGIEAFELVRIAALDPSDRDLRGHAQTVGSRRPRQAGPQVTSSREKGPACLGPWKPETWGVHIAGRALRRAASSAEAISARFEVADPGALPATEAGTRGVEQLLSGERPADVLAPWDRGYGGFVARELHPARVPADTADRLAIAMREVLAAVELVASGGASRVAIVSLADLDQVAARGLAAAQAAGVEFRLLRESTGAPTLMVGPVVRG